MTANILPNAKTIFIDENGDPLASGLVYMYVPNSSTPKDTWQDYAATIPNSHPITLDDAGGALLFGSGAYRQLVTDSLGNTIWDEVTLDPGYALVTSFSGTSITSVTIGTGSKSFTTQPGLAFFAGQNLIIASNASAANYMNGTVTSYNITTGALVTSITVTGGSGTHTDWNISISGVRGISGSVTTTGSPASGNLTKFSGSATITNGDLSGDVTTSATLVTTVVAINGTTVSGTTGSGNVVFSASPTFTGTVSGATASFSGTFTGSAFIPNGSSVPANGIYLSAANTVSVAANTTRSASFTSTGMNNTVIGATTTAAGSFTTTSSSSTSTATAFIPNGSSVPANGIYLPSANTVGIACNSSLVATYTSTGLNNTVIGASTAVAGTFTNLTASGAVGFSLTTNNLIVTTTSGAAQFTTTAGTIQLSALSSGVIIIASPSANAGTLDGLIIGSFDPCDGIFTALTSPSITTDSGDLSVSSASGLVKYASSGSFSANASVGTVLGSVGPVGSHTTVQKWLTIKDDGGTTRYIPCF